MTQNTPLKQTLRTGLACLTLLGASAAQAQYSYNTAGDEVTDARTGLVWKRCSEGQTWNATTATCEGTITPSYNYAQAVALTAGGWRLPNIKELASLADRTRASPAINLTAFPATPSALYWSSTPDTRSMSGAWYVNSGSGVVAAGGRASSNYVRLVR